MRQQGYTEAMAAAGLRADISLVSDGQQDTLTALRSRLASKRPPTALFCSNNLVTRHMLHSLHALGLAPPEPLALVGFDDFETADLLRPGITIVRQPVESMGRLAAELLFSRLGKGGDASAGKRMMLPVELVVRGSCGAKV
jgi:LacI family transcriptional regulator